MTVIGTVDLRDIDMGCMLTIDAEVITYVIDGSARAQYVINVPGVANDVERFQGKIPVFFDAPEDPYQDFILPSIVFKQNDYNQAFERAPYAGTVGRAPAKDANPVYGHGGVVLGYDRYVTQVRADPYDVNFDMVVYARRKQEMNTIVGHLLRKMRPPWFLFKVIDSLGELRHYDAGEMSDSNNSELADIADRTASWSRSFVARVEIDTFDDKCSPAMTDPSSSVVVMGDG